MIRIIFNKIKHFFKFSIMQSIMFPLFFNMKKNILAIKLFIKSIIRQIFFTVLGYYNFISHYFWNLYKHFLKNFRRIFYTYTKSKDRYLYQIHLSLQIILIFSLLLIFYLYKINVANIEENSHILDEIRYLRLSYEMLKVLANKINQDRVKIRKAVKQAEDRREAMFALILGYSVYIGATTVANIISNATKPGPDTFTEEDMEDMYKKGFKDGENSVIRDIPFNIEDVDFDGPKTPPTPPSNPTNENN